MRSGSAFDVNVSLWNYPVLTHLKYISYSILKACMSVSASFLSQVLVVSDSYRSLVSPVVPSNVFANPTCGVRLWGLSHNVETLREISNRQ